MAITASQAQDIRAARAAENARRRCVLPQPCRICRDTELRKEGLA
jgi:hypothetical protein